MSLPIEIRLLLNTPTWIVAPTLITAYILALNQDDSLHFTFKKDEFGQCIIPDALTGSIRHQVLLIARSGLPCLVVMNEKVVSRADLAILYRVDKGGEYIFNLTNADVVVDPPPTPCEQSFTCVFFPEPLRILLSKSTKNSDLRVFFFHYTK